MKSSFTVAGGHVFFLHGTEVARIYWNFLVSSFLKCISWSHFLSPVYSIANERKFTSTKCLQTVGIWRLPLSLLFKHFSANEIIFWVLLLEINFMCTSTSQVPSFHIMQTYFLEMESSTSISTCLPDMQRIDDILN